MRLFDRRQILRASFGEDVLALGDPPELLFERLIPVYFHHRYGIRAAERLGRCATQRAWDVES